MNRKIAVLSTGAIGSCVGADLTRAGYDAILIDQWPAHVEAMRANGLRIVAAGQEEVTKVKTMHLCDLSTLRQPFDIVFLTAKSYDTCWMVRLIEPYLNTNGALVSVQNSLNDEWIAPIIGYQRDIGCVVELSAKMFEPGLVKRNTDRAHTWFAVGELHGRLTPRVQELAVILGSAGQTAISANIWGAKWTKLVVNGMFLAVCGILGIYDWEITRNPRLFRLCIRLGREALQVGAALGYRIEPIFGLKEEDLLGSSDEVLEKSLMTLLSHVGREALNTVVQDHLKGRRSEVELLNGLVAKKGNEAGIPTPLNDAITSLTRQIEQKILKPELANLPLLEKLIDPLEET